MDLYKAVQQDPIAEPGLDSAVLNAQNEPVVCTYDVRCSHRFDQTATRPHFLIYDRSIDLLAQ